MSGLQDSPSLIRTHTAGAAIRKGQMVKLSGALVVPCSVANETALGVAINGAAINADVAICIDGACAVETASTAMGVNGAPTAFTTDANGRAIPHAAGTKNGFMLEPGIALVGGVATVRGCIFRPPF